VSVRRIAVTGGPGAGKTSVWRALSACQPTRVLPVSEVATQLFRHVFPQVMDASEREHVQHAIFIVQKRLESVHERRLREDQVLLCDRGTPDGAGYWPEGSAAFFAAMQTRWEDELARYDAVLFLETAAAGGLSIAQGNEIRSEDLHAAIEVDHRLYEVWSRHPRIHRVQHQLDFDRKVALGTAALTRWLDES
jgi:predicted ATPase